jgi:glycosyltransferase involved in cell wall biosynthesis
MNSSSSFPNLVPAPRLALISSGAGYTTRGIEMWMVELARHLPAAMDVELITGGPAPEVPRNRRRVWSLNRDAGVLRGRPWARRYQWEQLSMLPGLILTLRWRRRTLAYCGDPVLTWHLKRFQRLHGAAVVFMNGMRLSPGWARHLDGVHLLADPYLEQARAEVPAFAERFFAVPHFADTEKFRPATPEQKTAARAELGLPAEALVVATLGPIGSVSGKRLDFLAAEIAACPGAVLAHGGGVEDGAEAVRSQVREALGERARLLGSLDRPRVVRLFQAADAYSLGSLAEPFSIAILEAMASGLPVVHHHDAVMRWQTGAGGFAVDMERPGAAAAAFARLRGEPAFHRQLSGQSRREAEQRYTPDKVCAQLGTALAQVRVRR